MSEKDKVVVEIEITSIKEEPVIKTEYNEDEYPDESISTPQWTSDNVMSPQTGCHGNSGVKVKQEIPDIDSTGKVKLEGDERNYVYVTVPQKKDAPEDVNKEFAKCLNGIKLPSKEVTQDIKADPNDYPFPIGPSNIFGKWKRRKKNSGPFICGECNSTFNYKSLFTRHMRKHTGEKPYRCGLCQRRFNRISNLNAHVRTHTGERRVHCDVCRKSFSRNYDLVTHLRKHTGEKPYTCDICKNSFSDKRKLQKHILAH